MCFATPALEPTGGRVLVLRFGVMQHTRLRAHSLVWQNINPGGAAMSAINKFMTRGRLSPQVHGLLDYPLAAVLIAGPLVLSFDDRAATVIALVFGAGATVLAVATAWSTGIVRIIPPLLHGYADVVVTLAMIVLPFAVGFSSHTTAVVFYLVVGAGGLLATLATRFESPKPLERPVVLPEAA